MVLVFVVFWLGRMGEREREGGVWCGVGGVWAGWGWMDR